MQISVTAFYAGLLGLVFIFLSARIPPLRMSQRIGIGTGAERDTPLARAVRIHGNFAEYVPMTLILMALCEVNGTASWFIHGMGIALTGGRLSHAVGLHRSIDRSGFRVAGMALTWGTLLVSAVTALYLSVQSWT